MSTTEDRHRVVFKAAMDALVAGAPGMSHPVRQAVAVSIALKLRDRIDGPCPGYVVANGGDGERVRYRCWGMHGWEWTPAKQQAVRFSRRADAEAVFAEDEDAWQIIPIDDPADAGLVPVPTLGTTISSDGTCGITYRTPPSTGLPYKEEWFVRRTPIMPSGDR